MNTESDFERDQPSKETSMPDERGTGESKQTGRVTEPPPSPRPPKGPSLSLILGVLFAIFIAFVAGGIMSGLIRSGYDTATQWIAFATGTGDETSDAGSVEPDELQFYTCGMHPWVILPKPGQCPICRMELTPLDPDKFSGELTIDPVARTVEFAVLRDVDHAEWGARALGRFEIVGDHLITGVTIPGKTV